MEATATRPTFRLYIAIIIRWHELAMHDRMVMAGGRSPEQMQEVAARALRTKAFDTFRIEALSYDDVFSRLNMGSGREAPDYKLRSMSVGDLVVHQKPAADEGRQSATAMVLGVGWAPIDVGAEFHEPCRGAGCEACQGDGFVLAQGRA